MRVILVELFSVGIIRPLQSFVSKRHRRFRDYLTGTFVLILWGLINKIILKYDVWQIFTSESFIKNGTMSQN
jgi:hypothetical protein